MKRPNYFLILAVVAAVQIILNEYLNLTQYLLVALLPAFVAAMPLKVPTWASMVIAFAVGFVTDFLSTGMLGLTSLSLVPVALLQRPLLRLFAGEDALSHADSPSIVRLSTQMQALMTALFTAIALLIYVIAESAGTAGTGFVLIRWFVSTAVSSLCGTVCLNVLLAERH